MKNNLIRREPNLRVLLQKGIKSSLIRGALALLLGSSEPVTSVVANPDAVQSEQQKNNRSSFGYHDGHAEERRRYRHPELDVDPTNLRVEELRERVFLLEERIERLEAMLVNSRKDR